YVLTWDAAKLFEDCLRQADSEGRLPENLRDWPTYDRRAYETLLFFGFLERARERGALEAGTYLAQGILGPQMLEARSGLDQSRRGNLASAAADLLADVREHYGSVYGQTHDQHGLAVKLAEAFERTLAEWAERRADALAARKEVATDA